MKKEKTPIKDRVRGHWTTILPQLGIDPKYLDRKHHPCPRTGQGDDRFRFSNRDGKGNFFCACNNGKGDGFKLVECCLGMDYATAAKAIEELPGFEPDGGIEARDPEQVRRDLNRIQESCRELASRAKSEAYLASRGLILPRRAPIRDGHLNYAAGVIGTRAKLDAMVSTYVTAAGAPSTLHITYLEGERKAKLKVSRVIATPVRPMAGGAVRLFHEDELDDTLAVGEGIETSLAGAHLFGVPAWACLNANMLSQFIPPAKIRRLIILADHDSSYTGQHAAYSLAKRAKLTLRIPEVDVVTPGYTRDPAMADRDWNDQLLEVRSAKE